MVTKIIGKFQQTDIGYESDNANKRSAGLAWWCHPAQAPVVVIFRLPHADATRRRFYYILTIKW